MAKNKLPDTSLSAWRSISDEQLSDHHGKILLALKQLHKATSEQVSTCINLNYAQVSRRMSELERKQLIFKPGSKSLTRTGRNAYEYSLVRPELIPDHPPRKISQGKLFHVEH